MFGEVTMKIELGINGAAFIQQVMINNRRIEDQIQKGIDLALEDIFKEDVFIQSVRENTKHEILSIVNKYTMSWDIRTKITKAIEEKVGQKLNDYSEKIASKITENLK